MASPLNVHPGQVSGRGTRVLWVGGESCSSSWTSGLLRDKGALTWVRDGNFPCLLVIPREFSRWSCILSIAGGLMANNYPPGRAWMGNHTTQCIRTRGAQRLSRLKIVPVVLRNAGLNRETRCAYTPSAKAWQDAVSPKSCKCAAELLYELGQAIHGLPKVAGDTCTGFLEHLKS